MRRVKKAVEIIMIICIYQCGYSQNATIFTGFQKEYTKGENAFASFSYLPALHYFEKAFEKDSGNVLIKLRIADCYRLLNNTKEAEAWYAKVVDEKIAGPEDELHYAQVLLANKKYEESKKWFLKYCENSKGNIGKIKIAGIENLPEFFEDSLNYQCKPVNINTTNAEFSPTYYDSGIVFVSSALEPLLIKRKSARDKTLFFDLYYSKICQEGILSEPRPFDKNLNKNLHEGPATFFDNGKKMIFTQNSFSKINDRRINRLSLFYGEKNDDGWINFSPLPFNSSSYSVAHPTITKDGRKLYFISDMQGGIGGTDIYVSEFKDSSWTTPVNLGPSVNTEGNEMFPFIFNDTTLYFSSNGFGGLGGMDIYKSQWKNDEFSNVENLGYPVNSNMDDFGIIFQEDGKGGFYCSNRNKGGNDDDIFSFKVIKVLMEGTAVSKLKNKPLPGVSVTILKKGRDEVMVSQTDAEGRFFFNLDPGREYQLSAFIEDFRPVHSVISTKEHKEDIPLKLDLTFERTNKTYVKGVVKLDTHTVVPFAKVYYKEIGSDIVDTMTTDRHGEFHCEVESGVGNFFLAEANGKFDTLTLKANPNKKGSILYYLNMHMQKYGTKDVMVHVIEDSLHSLGNAFVITKELYTGQIDTLKINEKGFCTFKAKSFEVYDITALIGEQKIFYSSFNIKMLKNLKNPVIELSAGDKKD